MDVHSWSQPERVSVRHIDLSLDVRFDRRVMEGSATIHFQRHAPGDLILDTRGLDIRRVENAAGFELGVPDPILGAPLRILDPAGDFVRVHYGTSPDASALQWLQPSQTAGKRHPFLYTQSQAIHARSWIPLQDTPGVRITFDAEIRTPAGMQAVMGAERRGGSRFHMEQPVPSYLIAMAAGELEFRELGPRSGVWAEPEVAAAAAAEFSDTEAMIAAVEEMFGPYRWGRYDLLVLPPSFPFGGMENPRLTFTTPTILAGDKSLVSLVAHELAHSWSGNLVTNATWSDFWLNEGFTVYLERRILEKVYGRERAEMEAVLGRHELDRELANLPENEGVLHIDLGGRDPDDGCTLVPYEKGALLLRTIEAEVGRERFDRFLRDYFDHFAFQSITTTDFLAYLRKHLPLTVPVEEWITRPGIPAGAAEPHSGAMDNPDPGQWNTHQWLHFLRSQERPDMARIDAQFRLTESRNAEILSQWLLMAVREDYAPAWPQVEKFLCAVGRRKFVKPLFTELMKHHGDEARRIYARARPGYHPITQRTIDGIVGL